VDPDQDIIEHNVFEFRKHGHLSANDFLEHSALEPHQDAVCIAIFVARSRAQYDINGKVEHKAVLELQ
jgi:hypothetical protein